ncbi:MAG: GspE/PulE family protein [Alicyclobacillus macrosporangiidus]|uniref:GspE/PulE family protein n=1 Tax=Alicyclobacillus macrosporangiidus TaxID=392015 RepID=UPI0026F2BEF0|nr:GspE/PulE family protein [Alicyclobacillus macrosporangiidus]MCL6598564.1 GspE/PulE family protein [Alicyclobacillus macrosporangiidus]
MARKRLGDLLVEMGLITQEQLQDVLQTQRETKARIGELLIKKGYVTEEQIIEALEFQLGIPHINLYRYAVDPSVVQLVPEALARRHLAFPVKKDKQRMTVAMADPLDFYAIEDLQMSTGFQIEPAIASKDELRAFIERYYGMRESVDELKAVVRPAEEELTSQVTNEDAPVVRLVNQIIQQGLAMRASDIHIDPAPDGLRIRYRVDGVLRTEQVLPRSMQSVVLTRLKIMANLNVAERRLPQDGRTAVEDGARRVDVRVATLPTVHGERCVLRLLDPRQGVMDIAGLGLSAANEAVFRSLIRASHGMVLITGPTGSGKTSTLYAALRALNSEERNVITIEDPVEYQLPGVNQVQVNPAAGLTFARGLRSILRQDPDVVMVGEIRDAETAEIAIQAALTGHLVLSTLHTNDAVSALTRLVDMGIEPFLVASAVLGVVAQRLVRRVCDQCAEAYAPAAAEQAFLERRGARADKLLRGHGCGYCGRTGYRGRVAVHEVLRMDDILRAMVVEKRPDSDYRRHATANGMTLMVDDGIEKALAGRTTLAEVMRVTLRE